MTDKEKQLKAKEFDPGWNDPPLFSFESREAHSRQSKIATLNKRVVFPSSSSVEKQQAESNSDCGRAVLTYSSAPPKLPVGGPPKVALVVLPSVSTVQDQESGDNVYSLDVLQKNFDDVLYQVYSQEENKEVEEIKRRLAVMENMWKDGKFNTLIKGKLLKLSLALKEDRFEDSECLQRNLMVDHSNVCSLWMAAVRKLIYRKKESVTH